MGSPWLKSWLEVFFPDFLSHFLYSAVTVLLEYFDTVNYTCWFMHYNYNLVAACSSIGFIITKKGTTTMISQSPRQFSSHSRKELGVCPVGLIEL